MKLTNEQVKEIRARKKEKLVVLATQFQVSESCISLIRSNKRRTKHANL
jgi:hypothetical protein